MKSNELRIGNYVEWDGVLVVVSAQDLMPDSVKDLNPIPLTEEWITKFQFEVSIFSEHSWHHVDYQVELRSSDTIVWHAYVNGQHVSDNVNHVHSLQNLFFALTGEGL